MPASPLSAVIVARTDVRFHRDTFGAADRAVERHRIARGVRRRHQFLGARLAVRIADSAGKRYRQRECARARFRFALAVHHRALPVHIHVPRKRRHVITFSYIAAGPHPRRLPRLAQTARRIRLVDSPLGQLVAWRFPSDACLGQLESLAALSTDCPLVARHLALSLGRLPRPTGIARAHCSSTRSLSQLLCSGRSALAARRSHWLVTRHSSLVTRHSSLVTRHSPLVTRRSPLVARHSSLASRRSLAANLELRDPL